MTYEPHNAQTAVATVTAVLACAGEDADPAAVARAHEDVVRLLADLEPHDLDDVVWILSGWFAELVTAVRPHDAARLLRTLGAQAARERS